MWEFIEPESGTELYRYNDVTGERIKHFEDMLANNRTWFSSPLKFNDPFDCRVAYDIDNSREHIISRHALYLTRSGKTEAEARAESESIIPTDVDELRSFQIAILDNLTEGVRDSGMLCLTTVPNNPLMWTHYANSHTGVCFRFRARSEHEQEQLNFISQAQAVQYANAMPVINFMRDDRMENVRRILYTKAIAYAYEQEWRIVKYNDGAGLKTIPTGIIGSVICGVRIDKAVKERIVQACKMYEGDVEIVQAELEPVYYGLKFEREQVV